MGPKGNERGGTRENVRLTHRSISTPGASLPAPPRPAMLTGRPVGPHRHAREAPTLTRREPGRWRTCPSMRSGAAVLPRIARGSRRSHLAKAPEADGFRIHKRSEHDRGPRHRPRASSSLLAVRTGRVEDFGTGWREVGHRWPSRDPLAISSRAIVALSAGPSSAITEARSANGRSARRSPITSSLSAPSRNRSGPSAPVSAADVPDRAPLFHSGPRSPGDSAWPRPAESSRSTHRQPACRSVLLAWDSGATHRRGRGPPGPAQTPRPRLAALAGRRSLASPPPPAVQEVDTQSRSHQGQCPQDKGQPVYRR